MAKGAVAPIFALHQQNRAQLSCAQQRFASPLLAA